MKTRLLHLLFCATVLWAGAPAARPQDTTFTYQGSLSDGNNPAPCDYDLMKFTDHSRAQGAILGKAMSGLKTGKGLVLALVTLQEREIFRPCSGDKL